MTDQVIVFILIDASFMEYFHGYQYSRSCNDLHILHFFSEAIESTPVSSMQALDDYSFERNINLCQLNFHAVYI